MKRILEISAAEGGEDSRIFVGQLAEAYEKFFATKG
jgi:protein subunit release factor A